MSSRRRRKLDTTSAAIPRKRIIGQSANQSSGTRQVWLDFKVIWPVPWRSSIPLNEKTAAVAICTVMFTIALIVVACI
ncbi:MAG: hypothetical protein H6819_07030 [Phycisphaerales bacterium]|nr:hypothetical protein [Phycisphaerales bacterium]MCB9855335.1 hypothetical protein [Phycisphaerales bacterium]MCB9862928.1 hypothetical protein [Phycisphaerales bacterium]